MVGAAIIFLQTSCVIPQAIVLYRGRSSVLPERFFSLGKFGPVVNATAVIWVVFLDIVYCFPTTMPVTKVNMQYVSVVVTGLVMFVLGLWFVSKRKTFTGPRINMAQLQERRLAAIKGAAVIVTDAIDSEVVAVEPTKVDKI
jgi:choline transport protein